MGDKLKPCPFCGNAPMFIRSRESGDEGIICSAKECPAGMASVPDKANLIAHWNRRAALPRPAPAQDAEEVARLRTAAAPIAALSEQSGPEHQFVTVPITQIDALRAALSASPTTEEQ